MRVGRREMDAWFRRGFCVEHGECEFVFVPEDVERAIKPPLEGDMMTGRRQRSSRGMELDEVGIERDGVIVVDIARRFKTEDVLEIESFGRSVNVREVILACEASIVLAEIDTIEEAVSILDRCDVVPAECFDEAVLMGSVGALNTSFGLG